MARFVSQTLTLNRRSSSSASSAALISISSRILTHRHRSNKSGKAQLIEVDLESSSSSSSNDDVEVLGIRKLEDVIHNIIVKRSAPDWLPFMPGSSYWVPPRPSRPQPGGIIDLLSRLSNPLSTEESLSLSTVRGWPSSSYFIHGSSSTQGVSAEEGVPVEEGEPVEEKADEMVAKDSDNVPQPDEEE